MSSSPAKSLSPGILQPAPAWAVILLFSLLTTLAALAGLGRFLNMGFPLASLAVGAFLYFRYPVIYLGFNWWMWILTPFLRRVSDFRSSFTEPSPILLAPYLVTAIALITVFRYFPKLRRQEILLFILPLVGVFYGFLIGLILNPSPFVVARNFLDWMTPLAFGFHLLVNWRDFPSYYQNLQRVFIWAALVTGTYGVFQYLVGPQWDVDWVNKAGTIVANGYLTPPGAFSIRVFSTMQSIEHFGAFISAALLLLLSDRQVAALRLPASVVGYIALLLSLMRSAWVGWFAGMLAFVNSLKSKDQIRTIIIILVIMLVLAPLSNMEPFSSIISARLESISKGEPGRQETFKQGIGPALTSWIGEGIGIGMVDNAILAMFFNLGWLGTICYLNGLLLLVVKLFQGTGGKNNLFIATARAIVISCLVRLPVNGITITGVGGLLLWGFLGLNVACQKYSEQQSKT